MKFRGYASVFGERTLIGTREYGFWEQVHPRAFDRVLRERQDVRFLLNHAGMPVARTKNGTMTLSTDKRGLRVDADLADTQDGRDLAVLLERRDVDQMSFGFTIRKDRWEMGPEDLELRIIEEVDDLYDVSAVAFAAYPTTTAALLTEAEVLAEQRRRVRQRMRKIRLEEVYRKMSPDERFKIDVARARRHIAEKRRQARR